MTVEIRAVEPHEWPALRDLRLRALADTPDAFGSTIDRERAYGEAKWLDWISGWEGAENRLFAAIEGGRWVGMAVGSRAAGDPVAHVYGMWVDPAARRGGIGRRLLDEVVAWAESGGSTELELGVTETNEAARRLYERYGFADSGSRHPLREGSSLQVIVMRGALHPRVSG
jgi:ribosomal protein S18 acetylase RimI-like enzyme